MVYDSRISKTERKNLLKWWMKENQKRKEAKRWCWLKWMRHTMSQKWAALFIVQSSESPIIFRVFFSSSLSFVLVASSLFLMWHYKKIWSEMNKEPMYKPTHFYCQKWAHRLWLFCVAVKERKFVSCLLWMHHSHDRCGAFTAVTMHSIHFYLVSLKHFSLQTT